MRRQFVILVCLGMLAGAAPASAQSPASAAASPSLGRQTESFWAPFTQIPGDVKNFVSRDTAKILAPAAVGALVGSQFDQESIDMALSRLQPGTVFRPGNVGGGFYVQTGGAFALYSIGFLTQSEKVRALGSELVRSQILTQLAVQTAKHAIRRPRPDGSDRFSLPSGHAAGTFATATVLQRHFGWRIGVPAYAAGAYVASSRMSANKHHLSDVIMGAAFGIAAAHTVTVGVGTSRFDLGLAPTTGGGMVTLTRK